MNAEPEKTKPTLRGVPDLVAVCVAIPAIAIMLLSTGGGLETLSAAAFGLGLILMLGMSAIYHLPTWGPRWFNVTRRLDHAAIFLLMAGSYAPFCLCTDLPRGHQILAAVCMVSFLGVLRCLFWPDAARGVRAVLYVLLGLAMLPNVPALLQVAGDQVVILAAVGGALYIIGAGIYVAKRPNPFPRHFGHQEVFHLFVFGGATCHYAAVWGLVTVSPA